jgi:hypothetical protein
MIGMTCATASAGLYESGKEKSGGYVNLRAWYQSDYFIHRQAREPDPIDEERTG